MSILHDRSFLKTSGRPLCTVQLFKATQNQLGSYPKQEDLVDLDLKYGPLVWAPAWYWVYEDLRLRVHTKGPWFRS